jgi:regulator of replication initiation timing
MKEIFNKLLHLIEEIVRLRIENERLKEELKNERTLHNFRPEFPGKL